MKRLHRWFILPALALLVLAVLVLTGRIDIDTSLPLNTIAPLVAVVAGAILLLTMGLEARVVVRSWELPEPEDPPTTTDVIQPKPLDDAVESVEAADNFSKRATDRVRIEIDIEDARDD